MTVARDKSQSTAKARSGMDAVFAAGGQVGALMAAHDWTATPLGPIEDWPQSLRSATSICLLSRFPMAIFWGPELALVYNDAYLPALGAKHPRSLGQPCEECWQELWPVIGPMLTGVMERGAATWSDDLLLLIERHGFTEECYFTFSYSPIRDEHGGVGGVFAAVTETTDRVVGERRMETLRELGQRPAQATSAEAACELAAATIAGNPTDVPFVLMYLTERHGRARLAGSCGLPDGHPAAQAVVDLDDAGRGPGEFWPLASATGGEPMALDGLADKLSGAGRTDWASPDRALILPIPRADGDYPAGFLVAGINPRRPLDVAYQTFFSLLAGHIATEVGKARAYAAERQRAEALAAIDRAKTTFFSNVSHEFRTPLTLLLGPLEDNIAEPLAETAVRTERLRIAHRNALRLLKLVNSLLDFARLEAGRVEAVYEPVDLAAVTAELTSMFRAATERGGLELEVDCPPLPEPVWVDLGQWEKIILNLVSNAFKFTFDGTISVRCRAAGDHARISVADTGVGIPTEELPRLFERFHRVPSVLARTHEGSGIGLSLVSELVRLHGGTIHADSRVREGTVFTITIPFGTAHLPADQLGAARQKPASRPGAEPFVEEALRWLPSSAGASAGTEEGASPVAARPRRPADGAAAGTAARSDTGRVLVVDDNADMRDYLAGTLSPHWRVDTAADGQAALEAIHADPPDLVLADIMMPRLDGFGLLAALRENEATRSIPVIVLSARAGAEAAVEGLDAGADDYLTKPFTARELLARVRVHLTTARLRGQLIGQLSAEAEHLGELAQRRVTQIGELEWALEHRIRIEQAKGILMAREGLDERGAWEWLRQAARSHRRRVDDVARDLIAGRPMSRPDKHTSRSRGRRP